MKISTKGRYALRLMIDLAMQEEGTLSTLKAISKRQGISEKYLEQIITILNRAGYVRSVRGAGGGYSLAKKPEEYIVGDILRLTEGSLAPVACVEGGCDKMEHCLSKCVWQKIYDAVNSVVDNITLAELTVDSDSRMGENI